MTKYILRATSAALLLAGASLAATAADPPSPGSPAHHHLRAKQVLGTKILIAGNTTAGTVDDLVFDDAGNLESMVVADENGKLVSVPWDAAKWDLEKKQGVLAITADQYKVIPRYTVTTYPSFYTPTYRTETYKFYGLTPRELRRIERRNP